MLATANLHKIASNNAEVTEAFPSSDRALETRILVPHEATNKVQRPRGFTRSFSRARLALNLRGEQAVHQTERTVDNQQPLRPTWISSTSNGHGKDASLSHEQLPQE